MRNDKGNILKISFIDMHNIKKARRKVLYSGALINQKISVIKFTGTPANIKNINNNFLPEGCFVEKEESGLFYLNTSNKLLLSYKTLYLAFNMLLISIHQGNYFVKVFFRNIVYMIMFSYYNPVAYFRKS